MAYSMYRTLPPEPLEFRVLRGGRLSRRRVKALVRIGQRWADEHGAEWRVANVYRKDGVVQLRGRIRGMPVSLFPTFGELGRHYKLVEDGRS